MVENPTFYNLLKLFCFSLFMVGATLIAYSAPSYAQSSEGCATDTWTAMVNQAALETRREDLMNKRYIVKADSVLQYSCFTEEMNNTNANIAPIFSNGEQWAERDIALIEGEQTSMAIYEPSLTQLHIPTDPEYYEIVEGAGFDYTAGYVFELLSPTSLEEAVTLVVFESLEAYMLENFGHIVLSGTTELADVGLCYDMASVWQAAKCKNFDGTDIFYRFEDLVDFDPREFPPSMPCEL